MTITQYKVFSKITKNKQEINNNFVICFESLFASHAWVCSTLLQDLRWFDSLIANNIDSYEKFYREIFSATSKTYYGIRNLKKEYLVNILKTNDVPMETLFKDFPILFNNFYLWIKNEVLPQFIKYFRNKKNTIT